MTKIIRCFFLTFFLTLLSAQVNGIVNITVHQGQKALIPTAFSPFVSDDPTLISYTKKIPALIQNDLLNSGFFQKIHPRFFLQSPREILKNPRFNDWRLIGTELLLAGRIKPALNGKLKIEAYLWDVFTGAELMALSYESSEDNWRRIGHQIADAIYERITGERGYFDTRIIYVSEDGYAKDPIKRLAIMDQDGANRSYLTDGSFLVVSPRFSPNGQFVTYLSYEDKIPQVYLMDLKEGTTRSLGNFPGMSFAPRFSPDNKKLIYSLTHYGNSQIYEMDLTSHKIKKLTDIASINTSPSYSPDGKKIVFESDRGGRQQLYVMDCDGTNVRRISFNPGSYATPVWSPRGDLIAFTRLLNKKFAIGVMRPDGSDERILVEDFHVEGPDWSPNGRLLIFFREFKPKKEQRRRLSKLYTIDLTGFHERLVQTPKSASDPSWSL